MQPRGRRRWILGSLLLAALTLQVSPLPAHATFPGLAGLVAFVSGGDGTATDIWTMRSDGTHRKHLTATTAFDSSPAWSPDGSKLAFVRTPADDVGISQIWVIGADGSNPSQLTDPDDAFDQAPAWSADGTKIVFSSNRADPSGFANDLYVMGANGSNPTQLTDDPANETQPDWSPDGQKIAFVSTKGTGFNNIWVVDADGTDPVALTNDSAAFLQPAWWPDGSKIAFAANEFTATSTFDIATVPAGGGPRSYLFTTADADEFNPAPSPDGTKIFFDTDGPAPDGTPPEPGPSNVVGCTLDGTSCVNGGDGYDPSVEPELTTGICPVSDVRGRFEPTQAVWQDDPFWRDKKLGNKLVALSPSQTIAQLPMVKDKATLLFGYQRARGDPRPGTRSEITIAGMTTGTKPVAVKMTFVSGQTTPGTIETTKVLGRPRLGAPCTNDPTPFEVTLRMPEPGGVPLNEGAFTFPETGSFEIDGQLIRKDGSTTGIEIAVGGTVVATRGPLLFFQPAVLSRSTSATRDKLANDARVEATGSRERIPDYYPLAPGTLPTISFEGTLDLTAARKKAAQDYQDWLAEGHLGGEFQLTQLRREAALAEITRAFGLGASSSGRAVRVIVVLRRADLDLLATKADGLAASQKVIFVATPILPFTVGHEVAHTMPYLWSVTQMKGMCGLDYHNRKEGVANGFQVTRAGRESRAGRDGTFSLMETDEEWIDQCTYANLVVQLQDPPDPSVLLVQGRLARGSSGTIGGLFPAYAIDAPADLSAGTGGPYAIVLTGAGGTELGRFPFVPQFATDDAERDIISFQYRVPALPGTTGIELVGPGGVLDELAASPSPPSVAITSPLDGSTVSPVNGTVHVAWTGSDPDGDPIVFSILYSSDGGETWTTASFEGTGTSFDVPIVPGGEHVIRVLATDGMRGAESQVAFST